MKDRRGKSISAIFADGRLIDAAVREAAREAMRRHKEAGLPAVVWRDGRIVHVPPEKIRIAASSNRR
jgi:hypothetical protein